MTTLKELMRLDGRVAVITGGAGHIGTAMGEALAELGAYIAIADRTDEGCLAVARRLTETFGVEAAPIVVDLADDTQCRSVCERVVSRFGRLDILINCAAFTGDSGLQGWCTSFDKQTVETWRRAVDLNLTVPFALTQACADALAVSGKGSVINVSSIYGVVGPDLRLYEGTKMGNPAAYAASKGGLLQLTRWAATVMAPRVRVNAITPGGVFRNQPAEFHERYVARTPLGRMAVETDFKGAAAYLASDLSAYVTGQNLMIDGGWTVW